MGKFTGVVPTTVPHLIYSVVKGDQTGQYYTRDPLEALAALTSGAALVTCYPSIDTSGETYLALPGNNYILIEVNKNGFDRNTQRNCGVLQDNRTMR